jgi:hypothetical protein
VNGQFHSPVALLLGRNIWYLFVLRSVIKRHSMKTHGGMELQLHALLISILGRVNGQLLSPAALPLVPI